MRRINRILLVSLAAVLLIAATIGYAGADAIVVDGYDITASVSGTPLKDAYSDYFMMGVGLNGHNVETDTVNSKAMTEIISYSLQQRYI